MLENLGGNQYFSILDEGNHNVAIAQHLQHLGDSLSGYDIILT